VGPAAAAAPDRHQECLLSREHAGPAPTSTAIKAHEHGCSDVFWPKAEGPLSGEAWSKADLSASKMVFYSSVAKR
jgi:hypothetical protein